MGDTITAMNGTASAAATSESQANWRDVLPVHPLADAYPKVPHDRLVEIGESIRQHGLDFPIFVHAKGNPADPEIFELFDGVTRLNAMVAVGIKFEFEHFRLHCGDRSFRLVIHGINNDPLNPTTKIFHNLDDAEIAAKIDNANLHRRHLEPEQYHARIEASHARIKAALERDPDKSDRAHAKEQGVSDKTIAKVRKSTAEGSAVEGKRVGKDGKARKRPVKKAKPESPPDGANNGIDAEASADARRAAHRAAEERQLDNVCRNGNFSTPGEEAATAIPETGEQVAAGDHQDDRGGHDSGDRGDDRGGGHDHGDHGDDGPGRDEGQHPDTGAAPTTTTQTTQLSIRQLWESGDLVERDFLIDAVLDEYFGAASVDCILADLLIRVPAAQHDELYRSFIERFSADDLLSVVSDRFAEGLRCLLEDRKPSKPKPESNPSPTPGRPQKTMRLEQTGTDPLGNPIYARPPRGNPSRR
jgi:hypothetical protein